MWLRDKQLTKKKKKRQQTKKTTEYFILAIYNEQVIFGDKSFSQGEELKRLRLFWTLPKCLFQNSFRQATERAGQHSFGHKFYLTPQPFGDSVSYRAKIFVSEKPREKIYILYSKPREQIYILYSIFLRNYIPLIQIFYISKRSQFQTEKKKKKKPLNKWKRGFGCFIENQWSRKGSKKRKYVNEEVKNLLRKILS